MWRASLGRASLEAPLTIRRRSSVSPSAVRHTDTLTMFHQQPADFNTKNHRSETNPPSSITTPDSTSNGSLPLDGFKRARRRRYQNVQTVLKAKLGDCMKQGGRKAPWDYLIDDLSPHLHRVSTHTQHYPSAFPRCSFYTLHPSSPRSVQRY